VSEIIGVRVADVVLGPTSSIRLHGKGRKQRSLPLWKTVARAVRDWLHVNPQLQAEAPLLPRRDGKPMTRANVALVATSNSPTCGHSNSPGRTGRIMGCRSPSVLIATCEVGGACLRWVQSLVWLGGRWPRGWLFSFFNRLLGQAKRVRPEASAGERWSSHGPRRGRPQAGPVGGWLVHRGRELPAVDGGVGPDEPFAVGPPDWPGRRRLRGCRRC